MTATVTTLRNDELIAKRNARFPDLPDHMKHLPIDDRGFPVPWFVVWTDEGPQFPVADGNKLSRAYLNDLCWVCGGPLGKWRASVIGPMCAVNLTISEPQSHTECARFSARNCPFLANPRMGRVPVAKLEAATASDPRALSEPAGCGLKRNPGAVCVWISPEKVQAWSPDCKGIVFRLPKAYAVEWYAHGRDATRSEVIMSIKTGLPALFALCDEQEGAFDQLGLQVAAVVPLLPFHGAPDAMDCSECGKSTNDQTVLGCTLERCPLFGEGPVT